MVEGAVDYNTKDDKGEPISAEAAEHCAKFRIRCQCEKNFCSSCNSTPYHTGKTCEQFKDYKAAAKCRSCEKKMEGINNAMLPLAIRDFCNDEECKKNQADACTKMLECGHPCGGFRGEVSCLPCL